MEKIHIEETKNTPSIIFDFDEGMLELKGRSIPEDSISFYEPIFDAVDRYAAAPKAATKVVIQLEYFSTSSSKCILDLFKKLEAIHKAGSPVTINWLYEEKDEDMREAGIDYESIVDVPFKMVQIEE